MKLMTGIRIPAVHFLTVWLPTRLAIWWRTHVQPSAVTDGAAAGPRTFIIYRLDGLGDLVLSTPLVRQLKLRYPKARCTLVVQRAFRSLLTTNPYVDEILTLPEVTWWGLPQGLCKLLAAILFYRRRLRGRHFDVAISPRWDTDEDLATLLCVLTDTSRRIGYCEGTSPGKGQLNRGFERAFSTCLPVGPLQHEVHRNLEISKALGADAGDSRLEIFLSDADRRAVSRWWSSLPRNALVVALGIGARHAGRKWPLEYFAHSIGCLRERSRVQSIILCDESEQAEATCLARQLGKDTIVFCQNLRVCCAVLERCDLFIGNDSGCAHLAAAMNCKTIVISRHPRDGDPNHSNSPFRFAPHCTDAIVLQPPSGFGSCDSGCRSDHPHCITQVSVAQVVEAACEMLRTARPSKVRIAPEIAAMRERRATLEALGMANAGVAYGVSAGID